MKLTRIQQICFVFFACTLLPSYLIANWRHDANLAALTEKLEREHGLNLSTDKLQINCERNELKEGTPYDANHQICEQGAQEQKQTAHAMDVLTQEEARNDVRWYRNFFLAVLAFNLLGFIAYKAYLFLKRGLDAND